MSVAAPLRDDIISAGQLRDLHHLPCHRMEGGGGGRVLYEGEVGAGMGGGAGTRSSRVEVTDCSPAVSLVWHGLARPGLASSHRGPSDAVAHLVHPHSINDLKC